MPRNAYGHVGQHLVPLVAPGRTHGVQMVDPDQDGSVAVSRRDIRPRYLGLDIQVQISDLKKCFWRDRGVREYQMRNTMDRKTAEF